MKLDIAYSKCVTHIPKASSFFQLRKNSLLSSETVCKIWCVSSHSLEVPQTFVLPCL